MIYQYLLYQQISQSVKNSLKILIRCILVSGFMFAFSPACNQSDQMKMITKNDMTVGWEYKNDRIHFTMQAPVEGWVTIGFNTTENISGTYLVMGNVVAGVPRVVAHYTISPGNYQSLVKLGGRSAVNDVAGAEAPQNDYIKIFSAGRCHDQIWQGPERRNVLHHGSGL